jgi:hypothetical protein
MWNTDTLISYLGPISTKIEKQITDTIQALRETSDVFKNGFEAFEMERKRLDSIQSELKQRELKINKKKQSLKEQQKELKTEKEKLEKQKRRVERDKEKIYLDKEKLELDRKSSGRYYPGFVLSAPRIPLDNVSESGKVSVKRIMGEDKFVSVSPTSLSDEDENIPPKPLVHSDRNVERKNSNQRNKSNLFQSSIRNLPRQSLDSQKRMIFVFQFFV